MLWTKFSGSGYIITKVRAVSMRIGRGSNLQTTTLWRPMTGKDWLRYLETLLPEDWDEMGLYDRRNFLSGSDFGGCPKLESSAASRFVT